VKGFGFGLELRVFVWLEGWVFCADGFNRSEGFGDRKVVRAEGTFGVLEDDDWFSFMDENASLGLVAFGKVFGDFFLKCEFSKFGFVGSCGFFPEVFVFLGEGFVHGVCVLGAPKFYFVAGNFGYGGFWLEMSFWICGRMNS
jgi:hypothetical protein